MKDGRQNVKDSGGEDVASKGWHLSRREFLKLSGTGLVGLGLAGSTIAGPASSIARGATAGSPTGLLTALLPDPLGIEEASPRLSWIVTHAGNDQRQTAYRVQVADSLTALAAGRPNVWDSGRVESGDSTAIAYGGPPLAPRQAYFWRVRTWNSQGRAGDWSEPQRVVTGPGDEWNARPIWAPQPEAPNFRNGRYGVTVRIKERSAGLTFRASDLRNGYLWQFIAGSPGKVKSHVQANGSYRVFAERSIGRDLPLDVPVRLEIEMQGSTLRSYVDGELVDTVEDSTFAAGNVGMRNGRSESGLYDDISFVDQNGETLLEEDFSEPPYEFNFGTVQDGALLVGRSDQGLSGGTSDWAFLRREFELPAKPVSQAFAYVTALSPDPTRQYVYKLWVNDEFVGLGPVRSADGPRYHTHDLSEVLKAGANAIGALCYAAQDQRFLAQIEVIFEDGDRRTISSGRDWRSQDGRAVLPSRGDIDGGYYSAPQEYFDLRFWPFGWTAAGFDDSKWRPAEEKDAIAGLASAPIPNADRFVVEPASVRQTQPGHWLVDLGREIVGGLALDVEGEAGQQIEVRLGEQMDGPDSVRYRMRTGNVYREVWTLRDGPQHVEHWGYRGFRYAELLTEPGLDLSQA